MLLWNLIPTEKMCIIISSYNEHLKGRAPSHSIYLSFSSEVVITYDSLYSFSFIKASYRFL